LRGIVGEWWLINPETLWGRAKDAYPPPIEAHPTSSSATAPIAAKALNMSVSAIQETSPRVGSRASCGF
jgi:hypothetical protein